MQHRKSKGHGVISARQNRAIQRVISDSRGAEGARARISHDDTGLRKTSTVLVVSRFVMNREAILESLNTKKMGMGLTRVGFGASNPRDTRRKPQVKLVSANLARRLAGRFFGTSAEFEHEVKDAAKPLPLKLSGELGCVGLFGALNEPGPKFVGWHLSDPLLHAISTEADVIIRRFGGPLFHEGHRLTFAVTDNMQTAEQWADQLAAASPANLPIELGHPQPYPVKITRR